MSKLITGLTAGAVMGVALGMMVVPSLDRRTQRNIKKASRKVMNLAGDSMTWMR